MPAPGSSHALVLPASSHAAGDPDPVIRAEELLQPFLDNSKYESIAVVHGLTRTATRGFDLAKARITRKRGVVWVTDPALVKRLGGPNATKLKKMLKPYDRVVLTFWNVKNKAFRKKLKRSKVRAGEVHAGFLAAHS